MFPFHHLKQTGQMFPSPGLKHTGEMFPRHDLKGKGKGQCYLLENQNAQEGAILSQSAEVILLYGMSFTALSLYGGEQYTNQIIFKNAKK